jgi:replication-associated recombination protein RarA
MVRHRFCRNRTGIGDPCGKCDRCVGSLEELTDYEEWTGARLDADWGWWERNGSSILRRPWASLFIDEAQDLSERHQKSLFRDLEGATCQVIFATTHKNLIKDALLKRFGNNIYEMRRPTVPEVTVHLTSLCAALGVIAETAELTCVVELNGCDLRCCVDFAYTAAEQAPNKVVTGAFVESVFGVAAASEEAKVTSRDSRLRL